MGGTTAATTGGSQAGPSRKPEDPVLIILEEAVPGVRSPLLPHCRSNQHQPEMYGGQSNLLEVSSNSSLGNAE